MHGTVNRIHPGKINDAKRKWCSSREKEAKSGKLNSRFFKMYGHPGK